MDQGTTENKEAIDNNRKIAHLLDGYVKVRDMLIRAESSIDTAIKLSQRILEERPSDSEIEKRFSETGLGLMKMMKQGYRAMQLTLEWQKQSLEHQSELTEKQLQSLLDLMKKYGPLLDEWEKERIMDRKINRFDNGLR